MPSGFLEELIVEINKIGKIHFRSENGSMFGQMPDHKKLIDIAFSCKQLLYGRVGGLMEIEHSIPAC